MLLLLLLNKKASFCLPLKSKHAMCETSRIDEIDWTKLFSFWFQFDWENGAMAALQKMGIFLEFCFTSLKNLIYDQFNQVTKERFKCAPKKDVNFCLYLCCYQHTRLKTYIVFKTRNDSLEGISTCNLAYTFILFTFVRIWFWLNVSYFYCHWLLSQQERY